MHMASIPVVLDTTTTTREERIRSSDLSFTRWAVSDRRWVEAVCLTGGMKFDRDAPVRVLPGVVLDDLQGVEMQFRPVDRRQIPRERAEVEATSQASLRVGGADASVASSWVTRRTGPQRGAQVDPLSDVGGLRLAPRREVRLPRTIPALRSRLRRRVRWLRRVRRRPGNRGGTPAPAAGRPAPPRQPLRTSCPVSSIGPRCRKSP